MFILADYTFFCINDEVQRLMSKLKIQDIPHLEVASNNPTGGKKIEVRKDFGIDKDKFKAAGLFEFEADITANPKSGEFGIDYGYLYGTVVALGKNSNVAIGGGVST